MLEKWKSLWSQLFGGRRRTAREEKVLAYVVHRLDDGARLQDVVQDQYVRRMTTEDEMRRILADPRVSEGARGSMRHDLNLRKLSLHRPPRAEDPPDKANIGRGAPPA